MLVLLFSARTSVSLLNHGQHAEPKVYETYTARVMILCCSRLCLLAFYLNDDAMSTNEVRVLV